MNQTRLLGEHHERVAITKLRLGNLTNHTLTTITSLLPCCAEAQCQAEVGAVVSAVETYQTQLCVAFAMRNELNLASTLGSR
jgi:hypothetical protein